MKSTLNNLLTFFGLWAVIFAAASSWLWAPAPVEKGLWFLLWAYGWLGLVVTIVLINGGEMKRRLIYAAWAKRPVTRHLSTPFCFILIGLVAANSAFWLATLLTISMIFNIAFKIEAMDAAKAEKGGPASKGAMN